MAISLPGRPVPRSFSAKWEAPWRRLVRIRYATRLLYISWRNSNPPIDYSGGSEWNASSTGEYKSRGLYSSSLVASEQTVMRKREHAGFVTPMRLISLPNWVKSVIVYYKGIGTQGICQIVRICGVVGVKSDGMFTKRYIKERGRSHCSG